MKFHIIDAIIITLMALIGYFANNCPISMYFVIIGYTGTRALLTIKE